MQNLKPISTFGGFIEQLLLQKRKSEAVYVDVFNDGEMNGKVLLQLSTIEKLYIIFQ